MNDQTIDKWGWPLGGVCRLGGKQVEAVDAIDRSQWCGVGDLNGLQTSPAIRINDLWALSIDEQAEQLLGRTQAGRHCHVPCHVFRRDQQSSQSIASTAEGRQYLR